jgi:uncharacterized membrane protein
MAGRSSCACEIRIDAMADQNPTPMQDPISTRYPPATPNPASTVRLRGHPIHPMLVPFPMVCFIGAFVTDLVYWRTADMQWANFSVWLITAGLVIGAFAGLAGLTDLLGSRQLRHTRIAWVHGVGNILAMLLSPWNVFVHSRDAWTSVVPQGIWLSVIVAILLLIAAFRGWRVTTVRTPTTGERA